MKDDITQIFLCVDGPLLVRGKAELVSPAGERIESNRRTIALCRCGVSNIKPFCDGTHKLVGFRAEALADSDTTSDSSTCDAEG